MKAITQFALHVGVFLEPFFFSEAVSIFDKDQNFLVKADLEGVEYPYRQLLTIKNLKYSAVSIYKFRVSCYGPCYNTAVFNGLRLKNKFFEVHWFHYSNYSDNSSAKVMQFFLLCVTLLHYYN